ncbi:MAG: glycosyl hydrolase [Bifidobacterium psychraerophilum]|jgi:glucosylceramidase|uniref:glycoside hydrolase family 30 protein n=1 Tax=Bifidobacterium psychraerophilum TaxID=218140 RepID=UPI0023F6B960|nr:glycoside hydrolase family 30 beta sandwich domain-containing protein [Bifidobacterium psychraerophilum]MCI2183083.1 glycosyl hydrolase [Bifidobacterium psychraerophilum]
MSRREKDAVVDMSAVKTADTRGVGVGRARAWLSTDAGHMMQAVSLDGDAPAEAAHEVPLEIDHARRFQSILGFGASFTDSSAFLVNGLDASARQEVMRRLFSRRHGIGLSLLRNPMGACDYSRWVYSYDDMSGGATDEDMRHFSIRHDLADIVPLTKEAMDLNPDLRLIASPWSAPGWMKDSGTMITGSLLKRWYSAYARYFVRFIQAYRGQGIAVHALTVQNEPLFEPPHYPGMPMSAAEELEFVTSFLRPALERAGLSPEIWGYDHNWDHPEYPAHLLEHGRKAFDGIAWHWYGGEAARQSELSRRYDDAPVYFTEGSGGDWIPAFGPAFGNLMRTGIEILRHRSRSLMLWNIALDRRNGPVVPGFGRSTCRGLLRISRGAKVEYTLDYWGLAHFSSVIAVGAVRVESTQSGSLRSLVCDNPDGTTAMVLFNDGNRPVDVRVKDAELDTLCRLPSQSAMTLLARVSTWREGER